MRLMPVPAIDLKNGSCVRLFQGAFDQVSHYEVDPVELVVRYVSLGVGWVHVVDLDGARDGEGAHRALIARMAEAAQGRIQAGGGVRTLADVETLFALGAGRVVIGSVAAERPADVRKWLVRFGPERLVLAFDVRLDAEGVPWLRTRGWTTEAGLSLWDAIAMYQEDGLERLLCTDVVRDGAMTGPNLALYAECAARFPRLRLQASGGVRHLADLEALRATGAADAIVGKALLDGRISDEEMRTFLRNA